MEQDGIIGGGYQECESLKVAPVFPELNPIEQVWSWLIDVLAVMTILLMLAQWLGMILLAM